MKVAVLIISLFNSFTFHLLSAQDTILVKEDDKKYLKTQGQSATSELSLKDSLPDGYYKILKTGINRPIYECRYINHLKNGFAISRMESAGVLISEEWRLYHNGNDIIMNDSILVKSSDFDLEDPENRFSYIFRVYNAYNVDGSIKYQQELNYLMDLSETVVGRFREIDFKGLGLIEEGEFFNKIIRGTTTNGLYEYEDEIFNLNTYDTDSIFIPKSTSLLFVNSENKKDTTIYLVVKTILTLTAGRVVENKIDFYIKLNVKKEITQEYILKNGDVYYIESRNRVRKGKIKTEIIRKMKNGIRII
jgi:hypothetical protein